MAISPFEKVTFNILKIAAAPMYSGKFIASNRLDIVVITNGNIDTNMYSLEVNTFLSQ